MDHELANAVSFRYGSGNGGGLDELWPRSNDRHDANSQSPVKPVLSTEPKPPAVTSRAAATWKSAAGRGTVRGSAVIDQGVCGTQRLRANTRPQGKSPGMAGETAACADRG
jgi:hypothetical protein